MSHPLIDTHTHLHCDHFDHDRAEVLERAAAAGVARLVEVGYDLPSSRAALALAETHDPIFAVVGIQPNHAHEAPPDWREEVWKLSMHPKVVAIGEIGLDYYRNYAPHEVQHRFFVEQLVLARERGLPVVIHSREAQDDTIRVLRDAAHGLAGVMHSFSGDQGYARACLDIGFSLSFSGPVTFPKARELHEVARWVPLDALLIETDCPFLSPHPLRGKRNEPARVRLVAEQVAALRQMALEELTAAVWDNAERMFGW
ncbi:MAG: TatD family hydrolase [Chloroflexaceae bacterium]|nr:TatD family hydrolase [Chloroflexaceae bacterium]